MILEQAGHVHESVEALERLLAQRPDDPTLLNALGYTLADHIWSCRAPKDSSAAR